MDKNDITVLLKTLAQTEGASDLLITVGKSPQLRVYREFVSLGGPELTSQDTEELCSSVLTKDQWSRFKEEKELDHALAIDGIGRFRINLFRQQGHVGMVVRVVIEHVPPFEHLGLPPVIRSLALMPRGLVLITGPTGSGKSTTLAAMIDLINQTRPCHIVCIEDPIEYVHTHGLATVDQREVGTDTRSYHEALRRVLRQSPDVIMIGEVRDRESAQAAITLAETGHLTLATLHTRGAISAVNRLIDMFPPEQSRQMRSQLAASLAGVVWQQLLPAKDQERLVLACEVMMVTPGIRALILKGNSHEIVSLIQTGRKIGMCTMDQAVNELIEKEIIDVNYFENKVSNYAVKVR